ncbi:MAG: hypothetical protein FOGNACKC_05845 [Anaerolineae bacterium]|nr:hypothetical protein [Anaerolineae bacterium]
MRRGSSPKFRYWLRLALFFGATLVVALAIVPALFGALTTLGLLYAPCSPAAATPADFGLNAEPVTIATGAGGAFAGYFIPGSNGATALMPPPFTSNRSVRLPEAALLARHGYAVLTFESRRCAGLGPLSLGASEVREVTAALDYLSARPEVDSTRIGIHGFSSAGATAILAAAADLRLRAVVAEGGYSDFMAGAVGYGDPARPFSVYFMALYRAAMRATYRLVTGASIDNLRPVAEIGRIAPRPVLLIYGSREPSLAGGRQQVAAAGPSAQLWVVEGASHGDYMQVAPAEYERRLVEFFDAALLR